MLGSGAVSKFSRVCKILNDVFVTKLLPFVSVPPILQVTQVGSPENNSSYSGVLKCLTSLSFITN